MSPSTPDARRFRPSLLILGLIAVVLIAAVVGGRALWQRRQQERMDAFVSAFYSGLAAMEVEGQFERAQEQLTRAIQTIPEEPAAWANRGLFALRRGELAAAERDLNHAQELAPESSAIETLRAFLKGRQDKPEEAQTLFRKAIALDPANVRAEFALAQALRQQAEQKPDAEVLRLYDDILKQRPENLTVLLEAARVAAEQGDGPALRGFLDRLDRRKTYWPASVLKQFAEVRQAAARPDLQGALGQVTFLRNVMVTLPAYQRDRDEVDTSPELVMVPIDRFLRLPTPEGTPDEADMAMTLTEERLAFAGPELLTDVKWDVILPVSLNGETKPTIFVANGLEVRRVDSASLTVRFPGGPDGQAPLAYGVTAFDANYDFKADLLLAGAGGIRLLVQNEAGVFSETRIGVDAATTRLDAFGAWPFDVEMDGDLDVLVAVRTGSAFVLRNNGDGTFAVQRPFESVAGVRGFAWVDLDNDGAPDAVLLDEQGKLHAFFNERSGRFRLRNLPDRPGDFLAVAAFDASEDSTIDLVALGGDGVVLRIANRDGEWQVTELSRWPEGRGGKAGEIRLFAADLDNNGGLDLVAGNVKASQVWLSNAKGGLEPLKAFPDVSLFAAADLEDSGRVDLLGLNSAGQPIRLANRGTKNYGWQALRPRALDLKGDGRINTFGIGGEVEVRTGAHVQKKSITEPIVHFGLGRHQRAEVARIAWPNGTSQIEFDLQAGQVIPTPQRLKGSCPFIFADAGKGFQFVTDFIWRSPLGLRINAIDTAGVMQTEDWVKIRGDQMVARDGHYELRITAELWETHFFDHVSLRTIDHPVGTEVFVDERFAIPPPPLKVHVTTPPRPVVRAWDDSGRDVTDVVRARDQRYLDHFGRGRYQGVTRDHWVEVELADEVAGEGHGGPLWLLGSGWIHPTDSSINVALGQGQHEPPRSLSLEVPDGKGGWAVARPNLGFPAGKHKTVLIDVTDVFKPGTPRRLRLRTNLEIYWDSLATARGLDSKDVRESRQDAVVADFRYRGYSHLAAVDAGSPELPDYNRLVAVRQRWRDLEGFHTRFGDVRELLRTIDDRYLIFNAGDELVLRFEAPPPPPAGWTRDFVLVGDGWVKDGDFNTAFSKTVLPLPTHASPSYDTPPKALEDDPVYRRFPEDWKRFHTRYVTPWEFSKGLRAYSPP